MQINKKAGDNNMAVKKKSGLGKGLDAIFAENDTGTENSSTVMLRLDEIEPNRAQPRKEFNEEALTELADSIAQHGVIQPLLVRPIMGGGYQIVAGERRWRASRRAGVSEVPAVIKELTDNEVMELALIENLQREDLTAWEEALGYQTLIDTYGFTQEEVAKSMGKSRPAITNSLRLLQLPEDVLDLLKNGAISAGHARALLGLKNEKEMVRLAKQTEKDLLSVRELERLVKLVQEEKPKKEPVAAKPKMKYFQEVELALHDHLGRRVTVEGTKKRGVLQIEFYGEEDLAQLIKSMQLDT